MGCAISGVGLGSGFVFVGSDTEGTVAGSAAETTLCNVTIPANTVKTRLVIRAGVAYGSGSAGKSSEFRIKTGTVGAETTKASTVFYVQTAGSGAFYNGGTGFQWVETTLAFTGETSVLITAQNNDNTAGSFACVQQLVITGH